MTQSSILKLAKHGDARLIATIINHVLRNKGITAQAAFHNHCLHLIIESANYLDQQAVLNLLKKILLKLDIKVIESVRVQARQKGKEQPIWKIDLDLKSSEAPNSKNAAEKTELEAVEKSLYQSPKLQRNNRKSGSNVDREAAQNQSDWPAWFPYPSSWLRAIALAAWVMIVVRVVLFWFSYFGYYMAQILSSPIILLYAFLIGLALSGIAFAYTHYWIFTQEQSRRSLLIPDNYSIWQGIYALVIILTGFVMVFIITVPFISLDYCNDASWSARCIEFYTSNHRFTRILEIIGLVVWFLTAVTMYQVEFLIKENLTWNKILEVALLLIIGMLSFAIFPALFKNQEILKQLVSSNLSPNFPESNLSSQSSPSPTTSGVNFNSQPVPTIAVSIPSPAPTIADQADLFTQAKNSGWNTALLVQRAKTKAEWEEVVKGWETAIAILATVPPKHPDYQAAQAKITEYQANLSYAKLAASKASK